MKKRNGISLIVLIITIIIIIILAGVVILNITNSNSMKDAEKAVFLEDVSSYKDELMLSESNKQLNNLDTYDRELEDYDGKDMLKVIPSMKDKHIDKFKVRDGELKFFDDDDDEKNKWAEEVEILEDTLEIETTLSETSIIVAVKNASKNARYTYILDGVEKSSNVSKSTYTFDNLESGTKYKVKIVAKYKNGRILSLEKEIKTLGILNKGKVELKFSPIDENNVYLNTDVTAEITHANIPEGYRLQYSYTGKDEDWHDYIGALTIEENKTVYGRIWNNIDDATSTHSKDITLIDKKSPIITSLNTKDVTADSFVIEVEANDIAETETNACSDIKNYEYYINNELYETSSSNTCLVENREYITTYSYYVKVIDYAKNDVTSETKNVTTLEKTYNITYNVNGGTGSIPSQIKTHDVTLILTTSKPTRTGYTFLGWSTVNTDTIATYTDTNNSFTTNADTVLYAIWKANNVAPSTPSIELNSRNTNTITVKARATDSDADNLTYNLYVKTSSASSYTLAKTVSDISSGTYATLQAASLSTYTVYNCYVTVTDGKETATSTVLTTGTGCPGTGFTCSSGSSTTCTSGYTTTCSGKSTYSCSGKTTYSCSGKSTYTCTSQNIASGTVTCGTYRVNGMVGSASYHSPCGGNNWVTYSLKCSGCGGTTTSSKCMVCSGTSMPSSTHTKTTYKCSHGNTSSHTYTGACSHGYTSSHTYTGACSHGYTSSHTYTSSCSHGYTSSHTVTNKCSHGYTSSHTISNPCTHGYTTSHSYCSHGKYSTHYPN